MRRIIAVAIGPSLILALVACSGANDEGQPPSRSSPAGGPADAAQNGGGGTNAESTALSDSQLDIVVAHIDLTPDERVCAAQRVVERGLEDSLGSDFDPSSNTGSDVLAIAERCRYEGSGVTEHVATIDAATARPLSEVQRSCLTEELRNITNDERGEMFAWAIGGDSSQLPDAVVRVLNQCGVEAGE